SLLRQRKFCHCIPLRMGCCIISLILLFLEVLAPPLSDQSPKGSLGHYLTFGYRIMNFIHTLSCLTLFLGYFTRCSGFVCIFMCTFFLHMILVPIILVFEIKLWKPDIVDLIIGFAG
ncbi:hypothetical protein KR038_007283, partial [Drosophila bunnanda]